jgi:hypothetical protein
VLISSRSGTVLCISRSSDPDSPLKDGRRAEGPSVCRIELPSEHATAATEATSAARVDFQLFQLMMDLSVK